MELREWVSCLYKLMDFNRSGFPPYIAVAKLLETRLVLFGSREPLEFGSCT